MASVAIATMLKMMEPLLEDTQDQERRWERWRQMDIAANHGVARKEWITI